MKAVCNAGPLIHLTKIGLLDRLLEIFEVVFIPNSVYEEVVVQGKKEGYPDAEIVEQAINEKKIVVQKVSEKKTKIIHEKMHKGEKEAIELALTLKEPMILLDDEEARTIARRYKLKVKGSLGILIELKKMNILTKDSALQYLRELNKVMYISTDLYTRVEDIIKNNN